jgi:cupin fold WbuC family metalloprotein
MNFQNHANGHLQCIDPKTGSIRYLAADDHLSITYGSLLDHLKNNADSNGITQSRICFHSDVQSNIHLMLVYHSRTHKVNKHSHTDKDEYLQIIKGSVSVCFFDDINNHVSQVNLSAPLRSENDCTLCFIPKNSIHDIVMNEESWFLEITSGPYYRELTKFYL